MTDSHRTNELHFDLSGISLRLRGVPDDCRRLLESSWAEFFVSTPSEVFLDVEVRVSGSPAVSGNPLAVERVRGSDDDPTGRFRMPEGELEVSREGKASIVLAEGAARTRFYALLNLLLAALGWCLPSRRATVLHGAGVVLDGSAFALVGPAGAGKSTWAELAKSRGALYLSDDVVFLDASGETVVLLSVPIRANHPRPLGPGRWPLSAMLFPEHGDAPRLDPVDGLRARARLVANLLYAASSLDTDPRVGEVVDRILSRVRLRTLTFAQEPSFVELLRQLARSSS